MKTHKDELKGKEEGGSRGGWMLGMSARLLSILPFQSSKCPPRSSYVERQGGGVQLSLGSRSKGETQKEGTRRVGQKERGNSSKGRYVTRKIKRFSLVAFPIWPTSDSRRRHGHEKESSVQVQVQVGEEMLNKSRPRWGWRPRRDHTCSRSTPPPSRSRNRRSPRSRGRRRRCGFRRPGTS